MKEIDSLMNEFAQNSSTMPAYKKKFDKLQENVENTQINLIK